MASCQDWLPSSSVNCRLSMCVPSPWMDVLAKGSEIGSRAVEFERLQNSRCFVHSERTDANATEGTYDEDCV